MLKYPLVSIITPSFNHAEFIRDTIISVRNQNYPNIEHIIIDGGSNDNTLSIINKYKKTNRLRFISEPDEGQSDAINKGIRMAKGQIIGWLNSDDVLFFTDSVEKIVKSFIRNNKADIIFGDLCYMNRKGKILRLYVYKKYNYQKLLQYRYNLGQPAVFFRDYVLKNNLLKINLHYAMDFELWLRLGKKYSFRHIPEIIAGFRYYSETKSATEKYDKFVKERKAILAEYGSAERKSSAFEILLRGSYGRISGLKRLIKHCYLKRTQLAFTGGYLKFPQNIIKQLIGGIGEEI